MITSLDPNAFLSTYESPTNALPYVPFSIGAPKKKAKRKKHTKKGATKKELAQLYFQLGCLSAQYEILRSMASLAVAAKQGTLNDIALSSGLKVLPNGHPGK